MRASRGRKGGIALVGEGGNIFKHCHRNCGGLAQGVGCGGYKNAIAGAVSIGTGVILSKALNATIPRGWHGGTLAKAQANNRVVGDVIGALQGLADFLAPTQTTCPK